MEIHHDVNVTILYGSEFTKNAFWDAANSLNLALHELGFNSNLHLNCLYDEPTVTNIIFGAQFMYDPDMVRIQAKDVIVNLEPLTAWQFSDTPIFKEWFHKIVYIASKCQMWDYSHQNVAFFHRFGLSKAKYLYFGYNPALIRVANDIERDIDVLFYGNLTFARRIHVLNELKARAVNVVALDNCYGEELDSYLARAKLVLNIHAFDPGIFEIIRCFYLMNNGVAIVSEINPSTIVDEPDYLNGIASAPYGQLVEQCIALLNNPAALQNLREKAVETIKNHPQTEIMKALFSA